MVLEQGALTGKYNTEHPFPEDSDRGQTYNPMLPQLEKLNAGLEEIETMEKLGDEAQLNVICYWEKEMK